MTSTAALLEEWNALTFAVLTGPDEPAKRQRLSELDKRLREAGAFPPIGTGKS